MSTPNPEEAPKIPIDKLVRVYLKIRDAREDLSKKYEEDDGKLKEQQEEVKKALLSHCKELNVDSLKTQFGTASRRVATRYWTSDWAALHHFMKENDALDLLERRVHQGNMKAFLADHPELRPPGLNADSSYEISVRRSK